MDDAAAGSRIADPGRSQFAPLCKMAVELLLSVQFLMDLFAKHCGNFKGLPSAPGLSALSQGAAAFL